MKKYINHLICTIILLGFASVGLAAANNSNDYTVSIKIENNTKSTTFLLVDNMGTIQSVAPNSTFDYVHKIDKSNSNPSYRTAYLYRTTEPSTQCLEFQYNVGGNFGPTPSLSLQSLNDCQYVISATSDLVSHTDNSAQFIMNVYDGAGLPPKANQ